MEKVKNIIYELEVDNYELEKEIVLLKKRIKTLERIISNSKRPLIEETRINNGKYTNLQ